MLFVLIVITLLNLAGLILLARSIGSVVLGLSRLWERVINEFTAFGELEVGLHRLTRRYIGTELLINKVLPTIGYREPAKTKAQQFMLDTWQREVTNVAERPNGWLSA